MVGSTSSISKLKMNFLTSYGAEEEDEEAKFDIDDDFNDDDNEEDEDDLCEIWWPHRYVQIRSESE